MAYTCKLCEGNYESQRGLCIHQSSCVFYMMIDEYVVLSEIHNCFHFIRNNNVITKSLTDSCKKVRDTQIETTDIMVHDEFFIEQIL